MRDSILHMGQANALQASGRDGDGFWLTMCERKKNGMKEKYETWEKTFQNVRLEAYLISTMKSKLRDRTMLETQYRALGKERVDAPILNMVGDSLEVVTRALCSFAECLYSAKLIDEETLKNMLAEIEATPEDYGHDDK